MKMKFLKCINPAGVASLLMGLGPFKATGPDDIPAYLLKETANQLAPSLNKFSKHHSTSPSCHPTGKLHTLFLLTKKGIDHCLITTDQYRRQVCVAKPSNEHIISSTIYSHLA